MSAVHMIWKLILGAREYCVFNRLPPRRPSHNLFGRNCHRKGKTTEPSAKTLIPDCAWIWCLPTLKAIETDTNPAGIWGGSLSLCFSHCLSHGLVEIWKCHFRLPLTVQLLWAGGTIAYALLFGNELGTFDQLLCPLSLQTAASKWLWSTSLHPLVY